MAGFSLARSRGQRPQYQRMLVGIFLLYVVIIGFGSTRIGATARAALIGFLLWSAVRLRHQRTLSWVALTVGIALVIIVTVTAIVGPPWLISALVGASSVVFIGVVIGSIASELSARLVVNISTVLGVLCIYLLFALFFAALHQFFGALISDYVNGASYPPTAADMLYFSVITIATVGFGDITPVSEVARAVTVVEALTGQLYLVSVVAAVVGGWRGARRGE